MKISFDRRFVAWYNVNKSGGERDKIVVHRQFKGDI